MSEILKIADALAREKFTYVLETVDRWRSHAEDVKKDLPWKGDCDDLASTACHITIDRGQKKKDLWFAVVSSTNTKRGDHMIGLARTPKDIFVIGDTFGPMYPLSQMKHRLLFVHRLDWPLKKWQNASTAKELD